MQTSRFLPRASALLFKQTTTPISRTFASSSVAMQRISDLIKHDHDELRTYKDNILKATDDDEKVRWQNQFTWELARHSIAEELVVYPAMEKSCPGGKAMADKDRGEHRTVKELLYKFQGLNPDVVDFEPTLKALWRELSQHIKEEENGDLPTLEKHLSAGESEDLASSFNRTKAFVPSRSHPSAPDDGGPFETVAGLMAAPLDRIGDLFRKFPKLDTRDPVVADGGVGDGVTFNDPVGAGASKKDVVDDHPSPRDVPGSRVIP
ncbi:hemerythrin HHE cation binding domain protein [Aureobasidium sp. EXF-8845]|nr:hemerythrin HHE cation binding domain protein [Aureobasidium sp. EXF-8845]KAI4857342.1 hemerythrin HHE cation binding domain protein [Aureobasidium sp. EXF-8846]